MTSHPQPNCPTCKRPRPKGWLEKARRKRNMNISASLKGKQRPHIRKFDYDLICKLRDEGCYFKEISFITGACTGTISYALKLRLKGKK